jgi:adenosyl cobinamide kinase/adenosyl cobinamide phosphate guanylyltransferase
MLVPVGMQADPKIGKALLETQAALNRTIYDIDDAAPSDKRPQKDPENDWRIIGRVSEAFVNDQLGPIDAGGARTGGKFKEALDRFVDLQVERFSNYMRLYAMHTLNGTLTRVNDPIQAKQGKLGWLIALTKELHTIFGDVASMLEQVRMGRGASGPDRGAMIERRYREAFEEMRDKAGETKILGENPYVKAQKDYLTAVDEYLRFYRTNFARNAVGFATQRITDFLHALLQELDLWQQLLATNSGSLYMRMHNGQKLIQGERARSDEVVNHTIINDTEWENEKYTEYVTERNAAERLFEAWQWRTSVEKDGRGNPTLHLDITVQDTTLEKDMRRRWSDRNADAVLDYARGFFQEAIQKESILKYLMRVRYPDNAEALGNSLAEKSGHLLSMPETAIGTRASTFTLLAYDSGEGAERAYLQAALNQLVARRGYGDTTDRNSAVAKLLQSDDPFRLTLLSSAELIPIDAIESYTTAKPIYINAKYTSRQLYHIFPAEETATVYEEQLVRLNQAKRMLSDKVVLLLEDEARFSHFMFLLAHGVIYKADVDYEGQTQAQWVMQLPEQRGVNNFWWLTMPSENPSLLEALINFAIEQNDARARDPNQNYTNPIGTRYDDVLSFLAQVQREDALPRIENDNLGLKNNTIREQLEAFLPPLDEDGNEVLDGYTEQDERAFLEVAELVARRDILDDLNGYMKNQLPELERIVKAEASQTNTSTSHEERDMRQEEFDFFSAAVLLLTNEIGKLDRRIERLYRRQIGDANPL